VARIVSAAPTAAMFQLRLMVQFLKHKMKSKREILEHLIRNWNRPSTGKGVLVRNQAVIRTIVNVFNWECLVPAFVNVQDVTIVFLIILINTDS